MEKMSAREIFFSRCQKLGFFFSGSGSVSDSGAGASGPALSGWASSATAASYRAASSASS